MCGLGNGQVTGFVGGERAGWELLIERMGAELCKSLKKRVTTHLVCKEVRERDCANQAAAVAVFGESRSLLCAV